MDERTQNPLREPTPYFSDFGRNKYEKMVVLHLHKYILTIYKYMVIYFDLTLGIHPTGSAFLSQINWVPDNHLNQETSK